MIQKETSPVEPAHYVDFVDYLDLSESREDGPTARSIATARAAQQRERAAFTRDTGICVDGTGKLLRPSRRES